MLAFFRRSTSSSRFWWTHFSLCYVNTITRISSIRYITKQEKRLCLLNNSNQTWYLFHTTVPYVFLQTVRVPSDDNLSPSPPRRQKHRTEATKVTKRGPKFSQLGVLRVGAETLQTLQLEQGRQYINIYLSIEIFEFFKSQNRKGSLCICILPSMYKTRSAQDNIYFNTLFGNIRFISLSLLNENVMSFGLEPQQRVPCHYKAVKTTSSSSSPHCVPWTSTWFRFKFWARSVTSEKRDFRVSLALLLSRA